jgi:hypothetical protein
MTALLATASRARVVVGAFVLLTIGGAGDGRSITSVSKDVDEARRIAYVSRVPPDLNSDETFHAYVASDESDDAAILSEAVDMGSLDVALTWARERAERVVLSYGVSGAGVFSAGYVYYSGGDTADPLPEWPPPADVRRALDAEARQAMHGRPATGAQIGVEEPEER